MTNEKDVDVLLRRLAETPAGERIRMKCGAADLRSVITDLLATVRAEEREAALAAICPVLCGSCSNIANGIGLTGPRTLFVGHWVHLWKATNKYAQRCGADMAIRALEAAAAEKQER